MATSGSSSDIRNFQCVTVASVDVIKLPLRDILASYIKPVDLYHKIKSCSTLKLRSDQQKIFFIPPPGVPDYNTFDVTLLYTLIRNLCSLPCPAQGWGNEPRTTDTQISDDIERLRLFRNNYYAHAESAVISDAVFKDVWRDLKLVFRRIQPKTGYSIDYEEELINIERTKFTDNYLTTLRVLLKTFAKLEKQTDGRDEPDIFIQGENEILCGGTAQFEADVKNIESSCWSITWQKRRGDVIRCIDTNTEKYNGSTKKKLVINDVCKEDEGEYQAVLSFESNGPDYKSRNTIRLYAIGEMPYVHISGVTSGPAGITIHYKCGALEQSPIVYRIEWSKNGQQLDNNSKKYVGGSFHDSCLTITSPTHDDKGIYSCTVTNRVGSVSKNISLDIPSVKIFEDSSVCFGSKTTIRSVISSNPPPEKIEWQKSMDGVNFSCIRYAKYPQSTNNSTCPSFVIKKTSFDDRLFYRLLVWNVIGESVSNTVFLNVTGSPPNITTSFETNIEKRSVKLTGNVYFFYDSPGIVETIWTKDNKKINTEEIGGKLSEISNTDNFSLVITNVSPDDAGEYKLTAINAVGSSTSDAIVLGAPGVFLERVENEENGDRRITMTIKSLPAPCHIQWSAKRKGNDTFTLIDINTEQFKGTTVSLPHPVLVVRQKDQLENTCFRIDVTNFIGKTMHDISSNINPLELGNTEIVKNRLYDDQGASVKFTILSNILVKRFPPEKVELLKFSLKTSNKVRNEKSVGEATSALDCLRILQDENLLTQTDVIFMQFLCRETKCFDLYKECIEYAEKQKALCYFEKMPVNGYTDVECHVKGDLSRYPKEYIRKVKETVAAILDCREEDILLNGVRHSTSFLLSLSVKEVYIWKVLIMNEQDRQKLRSLDIDYLIVDTNTIDLEEIKGPPNITTSFETNIKNKSVKLTGNLYFIYDSPGIVETFWTKDNKKINTEEIGGKLSEISNTDNLSLVITNVSPDDAGEYKLTAINAVGPSTSDAIVLGIPSVFVEKIEYKNNGGQRISLSIKSFPAPCHVQWSAKSRDDSTFTPFDIYTEEYEGTTVSFPHPVLVVRQRNQLEKYCFQIQVTNFIGKTVQEISDSIGIIEYSLQDVVRCHLCETQKQHLHCDLCKIYLCEDCMEEHLSNKTMEHKVVELNVLDRTTNSVTKYLSSILRIVCRILLKLFVII